MSGRKVPGICSRVVIHQVQCPEFPPARGQLYNSCYLTTESLFPSWLSLGEASEFGKKLVCKLPQDGPGTSGGPYTAKPVFPLS